MLLLAGIAAPSSGTLTFNGVDATAIDPHAYRGRIAYVPQEPFLFSATVAENIAMGSEQEVSRDRIVAAARLAAVDEDIARFPDGYDTMVGERGITLSGGQRQRVAIARALVRDSDLLIMDDALSSVDSDTETAILTSLRTLQASRTIVIVSHRVSALKLAERIAVMDGRHGGGGRIAQAVVALARTVRTAGGAAAARGGAAMSAGTKRRGTRTREGGLDLRHTRRLAAYVLGHKVLVGTSLVAMLSTDLLQVLTPALIKLGIDRDIAAGDLRGLRTTALLLAAAMVGRFVTQVVFTVIVEMLGQRLLFDLRLDLLRKVLRLGNDYFDRTPVGATLTNVTNDVEAVRQFISDGIVNILGDSVKVLFILGAMVLINPGLAAVTFISLPLFAIATVAFRNALRHGFRGVRAANAAINTSLSETVTGIREITVLNYQARSLSRFEGHNRDYLSSYLEVVRAFSRYFPTIEVVSHFGMLTVMAAAHFMIGVSVQVGDVFAFAAYITMLFMPLRQLAEKFNSFQSAMAASERIFTMLDRRESIAAPSPAVPLPPRGEQGAGVTFRGVSFAYVPAAPVLTDLSFQVRPGERIALVGSTGSGKSTVISLINRLYDVGGGVVEIDGVDVRLIATDELRRRIVTIPQSLFLFSGTVHDNIALFDRSVSRAQVVEAARAVNLDGFIRSLPRGYDEEVLEEGKSLSTGQKQLLSFARAFVRDPDVVIMDEATSSIDAESERLIEEATAILLAGRTAIVIAHRLSTIRSVDRILVLHDGQLAEKGDHDTLLARDGVYAKLYRVQLLALADRPAER